MKPNWENRTLWTGDNLDIMRGLNSESVDLIYLDPPFNSNRNYSAPVGSEAAGAAFKDTWSLSDVDNAWHGEIADREPALYAIIAAAGLSHSKGMMSYLIMMAIRLLEMKRILKDTGSIYLHCDPTASHYLKGLMDTIFGHQNFLNEIIWHYGKWTNAASYFQRNHDVIFIYVKSKGNHIFSKIYTDARQNNKSGYNTNTIGKGANKKRQLIIHDQAKVDHLIAIGKIDLENYDGVLVREGTRKVALADVWPIPILNPQAKERVGYPTQKPLTLLKRIIEASCPEGGIVLDPFAGCATACVAAEQLQRQWIGIDLSPKAAQLVNTRLEADMGLFFDVHHREDFPTRTDHGKLPSYKTHKHTLFGMQEGICNGCQHYFPFRNQTIDHIVPQAKGGLDNLDNLQLLCNACQSVKGVRSHSEFIVILKERGLRL